MENKIENVKIELTKDEALVLFEFLARFEESELLQIIDPAEERALWNIHSLLQKQLVMPFSSEYRSLLKIARNRLRGLLR